MCFAIISVIEDVADAERHGDVLRSEDVTKTHVDEIMRDFSPIPCPGLEEEDESIKGVYVFMYV